MAESAQAVLSESGYQADMEIRHDTESPQRGAALALFADEKRCDLARIKPAP